MDEFQHTMALTLADKEYVTVNTGVLRRLMGKQDYKENSEQRINLGEFIFYHLCVPHIQSDTIEEL